MATITRFARTIMRSDSTRTPWRCCSIRRTGDPSTTRWPRCRATRCATSWEPPWKRDICAPPLVSKLRSKVPGCCGSPEAATKFTVQRSETSAVSAPMAARETRLTSRRKRSLPSLFARTKPSSVCMSHSRARGAFQGEPTGISRAIWSIFPTTETMSLKISGSFGAVPVRPLSM